MTVTRRLGWIVAVMIALALAGGTVRSRLPAPNPGSLAPQPVAGHPAPDFTLEVLGGGKVHLEELRGNVVMINFWASWCPPCRREMPDMQAVFNENRPGLIMLAVNLTASEGSVAAVKQYLTEGGYTFPVLLDPQGEVAKLYRVTTIPTTLIIDQQGIVRARFTGPLTKVNMKSAIEEAMR